MYMNTEIIYGLIEYPSVFLIKFIGEPLITTAFAYGIVWLVMRSKIGQNLPNPLLWHLGGIAVAVIGSAIIRIIAIATLAGLSAYELAENSDVTTYTLLIPAGVAVGYITWLKQKSF